MDVGSKPENLPTEGRRVLSFSEDFLVNLLRQAQNSDGGWGYRPGLPSSVEPTAWSILALRVDEPGSDKALSAASTYLYRTQLAQGAWPTNTGKDPGCWTTALACLAVLKLKIPSDDAIARGLKWLCATWPAEGGLIWRIRQTWVRNSQNVARQDCSLRGWSWTPNTASWVEPTAYVLILLQNAPEQFCPPEARERIQMAERMLYDRVCPGGGWNAGNPLVYGAPGVPRIGPTVWGLLALRHHKDHSINRQSVAWLESNYSNIGSPGSLALAQLCLRVYGSRTSPIEAELGGFYQRNQFLQSVPVVAWALLALNGIPGWLGSPLQDKGKV